MKTLLYYSLPLLILYTAKLFKLYSLKYIFYLSDQVKFYLFFINILIRKLKKITLKIVNYFIF